MRFYETFVIDTELMQGWWREYRKRGWDELYRRILKDKNLESETPVSNILGISLLTFSSCYSAPRLS